MSRSSEYDAHRDLADMGLQPLMQASRAHHVRSLWEARAQRRAREEFWSRIAAWAVTVGIVVGMGLCLPQ